MKKFFSLVFMLFVIFTTTFSLFACKKESRDYSANISESDIALLTLFTHDGKSEYKYGLFDLGHTFFSIENLTNNNLKLSKMTIKPNSTISFGTWPVLEHFGVWYNLESNYIAQHDRFNGRLSITIGINNEDINSISQFIENNDRWTPIHNCAYFAVNIWNMVATNSEYISKTLIYTPDFIAKEIRNFDNYEINKEIKTSDIIGYFDNNRYISFKMEGDNYEAI